MNNKQDNAGTCLQVIYMNNVIRTDPIELIGPSNMREGKSLEEHF